jgi:2,3-bisphosphoglycerate-independent phosphoglycerate mutase
MQVRIGDRKPTSGNLATPMADAVRRAYRAGQEDETLEPLVLTRGDQPVGRIAPGDYIVFYNIRGEREVQLTRSLVEDAFDEFPVMFPKPKLATMIRYADGLPVEVAFPPLGEIHHGLTEAVSDAGLRQLKLAESEKGIHITYFFNGKRTDRLPGERVIILPSPDVAVDYDEKPEMRAQDLARVASEELARGDDALIVMNLANVDVVGHLENRKAVLDAISAVDRAAGLVIQACRRHGVVALVTADHGTVEKWYYPDGTIDTGHTDSPVPFTVVAPFHTELRAGGSLVDVAPSALHIMGLPIPDSMEGRSLLTSGAPSGRHRVLLLIVDGWGHADLGPTNLISQAEATVLPTLQRTEPTVTLVASGRAVGMPEGTVGNSEAGHLHLGAGRMIPSDRLRVEQALEDGSFYRNPAFLWAMQGALRDGKTLHLLGIVSFYSSHGSVEHLIGLLRMAREQGLRDVMIHSLLGRRGERPEAGAAYVGDVELEAARLSVGRVASVIGRYWALDREQHWDRVEKAYRLLVDGIGRRVSVADQ